MDLRRGWSHGCSGSTEDAGYWTSELMRKNGFFNNFDWLKGGNSKRKELSGGPTIATVVGDIETTMFDAELRTYGEDLRECIPCVGNARCRLVRVFSPLLADR